MILANMMDEIVRRYSERDPGPPDPSGRPGEWELPLEWFKKEAQSYAVGPGILRNRVQAK
jgi:hypothetical protein